MRIVQTMDLQVDVDTLDFRKSSKSDNSGPYCVEVAEFPGGRAVRDSKNPAGPVLLFNEAEWSAFREAMKADEL